MRENEAQELGARHRTELEQFFGALPSELEAEYLAALEQYRLAYRALVEVVRKAQAVMTTDGTVQ